jgi:hypothetical protein
MLKTSSISLMDSYRQTPRRNVSGSQDPDHTPRKPEAILSKSHVLSRLIANSILDVHMKKKYAQYLKRHTPSTTFSGIIIQFGCPRLYVRKTKKMQVVRLSIERTVDSENLDISNKIASRLDVLMSMMACSPSLFWLPTFLIRVIASIIPPKTNCGTDERAGQLTGTAPTSSIRKFARATKRHGTRGGCTHYSEPDQHRRIKALPGGVPIQSQTWDTNAIGAQRISGIRRIGGFSGLHEGQK